MQNRNGNFIWWERNRNCKLSSNSKPTVYIWSDFFDTRKQEINNLWKSANIYPAIHSIEMLPTNIIKEHECKYDIRMRALWPEVQAKKLVPNTSVNRIKTN